MRVALCILACLSATGLAGCLDGEAPPATQQDPSEQAVEQVAAKHSARPLDEGQGRQGSAAAASRLDDAERAPTGPDAVAARPYTRDDWFLLPVAATTAGGIASFRFVLPEGAEVPDRMARDERAVWLEVAPALDGNVDAWTFLVVAEGDDAPVAYSHWVKEEIDGTLLYEGIVFEADPRPRYVRLDDLSDGDVVHFVVGAQGTPNAVATAFRFLDQGAWEGDYDWPSEDNAEFLGETAGQAWVASPIAQAQGFQVVNFLDLKAPLGSIRMQGGPIQVEDASIGAQGVMATTDIRLTVDRPAGEGFTLGWAAHYATVAAGTWRLEGDVRDLGPIAEEGVVAQASGGATYVVTGYPGYSLLTDGTGSSRMSWHLSTPVEVPEYRYIWMQQLDMDATLFHLTGSEVEDRLWTYDGLVPMPLTATPSPHWPLPITPPLLPTP